MNCMNFVSELKNKIINDGYMIDREETLKLYEEPLEELAECADEIRKHFCGNKFDICTIINGKSGRCSENCKYCAQSSFYKTRAEEYPLLDSDKIIKQALYNEKSGVLRYSIVTSGRRLSDKEVDKMCETVRELRKKSDISVCVSFGLLNESQFVRLKEAGVSRVHNNLETSKENFLNVCTTHTFEDKTEAIMAAKRAGLDVCSGGIMGIGESREDRISMAFSLRKLGINSVPVNMLNPIPGTPYENNKRLTADDMRRICAVYRFILPSASIRLAGGRGLLDDMGKSCFKSGANAAISGDMLTTSGITVEKDMKMLEELNYTAALCN